MKRIGIAIHTPLVRGVSCFCDVKNKCGEGSYA